MSAGLPFADRLRALLVQALERRWPGCGAHHKVDQATRTLQLRWSGLLPRATAAEMQAFADGWAEASAAWRAEMEARSPFDDSGSAAPAKRRHAGGAPPGRQDRAAADLARARLEALFQPPEGRS